MAALPFSAVRQRIATAIGALSGWTESRYAPPAFGQDTANLLHHSFSVGTAGSSPAPPGPGQRQRLAEGARMATPIVIRWASRTRGDAQVSDYDAALDDAETLIQTVMGVSETNLHMILDRMQPPANSFAGEFFFGELRFLAEHRIALT